MFAIGLFLLVFKDVLLRHGLYWLLAAAAAALITALSGGSGFVAFSLVSGIGFAFTFFKAAFSVFNFNR